MKLIYRVPSTEYAMQLKWRVASNGLDYNFVRFDGHIYCVDRIISSEMVNAVMPSDVTKESSLTPSDGRRQMNACGSGETDLSLDASHFF